jgi:dual 3',5'-cyclic-AMP and -GMP phosphodiesterase 11
LIFQEEFKRVISCLEDAILATDLAVYFRRRAETFDLIDAGNVDWSNDNHRLAAHDQGLI